MLTQTFESHLILSLALAFVSIASTPTNLLQRLLVPSFKFQILAAGKMKPSSIAVCRMPRLCSLIPQRICDAAPRIQGFDRQRVSKSLSLRTRNNFVVGTARAVRTNSDSFIWALCGFSKRKQGYWVGSDRAPPLWLEFYN